MKRHWNALALSFALAVAPAAISEGEHGNEFTNGVQLDEKGDWKGAIASWSAWLKKNPEAKEQFEAFISEAQQTEGPAKKHLVHCHTRLMELAQESNDDFTEKLHRGIGLYLLAKQHALIDENEDPGQTQQLIFKAIHELEATQKMHREDARPSWYLYACWTMLNQPRPAEKALHEAQVNAPFSKLTPGENRELQSARRSMEGK